MDYLQQLFKDQKVEWKKLGEVAQYSKTRIDASLLNENNYVGVDNLLQNCKGKTFSEHVPITGRFTAYAPKNILIGNIRPYLKKIWFADNEGGTNGDVLVIQTTDERVLPEYLYQVLSDDAFFSYDMQHAKGAKMPRGNKDKILDYIIPLPPLSVQSRIVEILDKFTALEAELEAELELRKKQYQHYREQLLNFSSTPPHEFNVIWRKLGEVAEYEQPTAYLVKDTEYKDDYPTPVLTAGKTFILGYTNETEGIYEASKHPTIIFDDFTTALRWVDFDFKAKSSAMKMITSKDESVCLLKYIYYWLCTLPSALVEGDHKRQWISNYANKDFPLPPLSVQSRIVEILDKFDTLTNSITEGLPLEIKLRRQQYEYYREQLLDFRN